MKYFLFFSVLFFWTCQIPSTKCSNKDERGLHFKKTLETKSQSEFTFTKYIESIPMAKFPIKYSDYEKLFTSCPEQSCNTLCINKSQLKGLIFFHIENHKFLEIKKHKNSNTPLSSVNFKYGPQGGKFGAELGITSPLFHCKNDKFVLIGYLSEWWIRGEGGDFYTPRAQLDLVTYTLVGELIEENINSSRGSVFPYNQLIVNLPDLEGCREIRADIKSWNSLSVQEKVIKEYETRLSENGLDEEYIEYDKPKIILKEITYTISKDGVISKI